MTASVQIDVAVGSCRCNNANAVLANQTRAMRCPKRRLSDIVYSTMRRDAAEASVPDPTLTSTHPTRDGSSRRK